MPKVYPVLCSSPVSWHQTAPAKQLFRKQSDSSQTLTTTRRRSTEPKVASRSDDQGDSRDRRSVGPLVI